MIAGLIYLGFAISTGLFAQEAYQASVAAHGHPVCSDYVLVENTGDALIHAEPYISLENPYHAVRKITYHFKMCTLEDGRCATPFTRSVNIQPNKKYQHAYRLNMNVNYPRAGDYHYVVMTDITGDVVEHEEKACGIHVRKK